MMPLRNLFMGLPSYLQLYCIVFCHLFHKADCDWPTGTGFQV